MDFYSRHVVNSVFYAFLHNCPLLISLHNTAVLIKICRFWINVVKFLFTQTITKLDLPTLRNGSIEERTQLNKKNLTLAGSRTQVSAILGPRVNRYATGESGITWFFILLSFSDLKFIPLPSLRVDFYSRHVVNSVFMLFFIIVHCWFHYITQQFSSKYVAFESTLLNFYLRKPLRNWTFQRFAMAA